MHSSARRGASLQHCVRLAVTFVILLTGAIFSAHADLQSAIAAAPEITTLSPDTISNNSVMLRASVNPHGLATSVEFILEMPSPPWMPMRVGMGTVDAGNGSSPVTVQFPMVAPWGPAYLVTARAINGAGTALGESLRFTVWWRPGVEIAMLPPSAITNGSATLRASVNPHGQATSVEFFLNGISKGLAMAGNGSSPTTVELAVGSLTPQTRYAVTSIGKNTAGSQYGDAVEFFTTAGTAGFEITTLPADSATPDLATLRASVNPHGQATSVEFFLDGVSKGTVSAGSGSIAVTVELPISGLGSFVKSYTVTTSASSTEGNALGGALQFSTTREAIPVVEVETLPVGGIISTSATLRASVNPRGMATSIEFFLDGVSKGTVSAGSGSAPVTVELPVSGLDSQSSHTVDTRASYSFGYALGGTLQFATTAPTTEVEIATLPVTGIGDTSATLRASVNPHGLATNVEFFLDGVSKGVVAAGSGLSQTIVELPVSRLTYHTNYTVTSFAANTVKTTSGGVIQFTTPAAAPAISTLYPDIISNTWVMLRASVNPRGLATSVEFIVEIKLPEGISIPVGTGTVDAGSGSSPVTVQFPMFAPWGPTCQVATRATNVAGTALGGPASFAVPFRPYFLVTTLPPSAITGGSATLQALVNPHGVAYSVEFFLDGVSKGSVPAGSSSSDVVVKLPVSGLASQASYKVTARAYPTAGNAPGALGNTLQFTTTGVEIATLPVTAVTSTSATLRASVNPHGLVTTVEFFLDGVSKGSVPAGSGAAGMTAELPVSGLVPLLSHTVSTRAFNATGTASGGELTFELVAPTTIGVAGITTLPIASVTPVSAILRATVNPNGQQTSVTFFLDGVIKGMVDAGNGIVPVIVELAVTGLSPQTLYVVKAGAVSVAGYNESAPVPLVTSAFGEMPVNASHGQFELTVFDSSTVPKPVGKLAVLVTGKNGAFSGTLNFDGVVHRLRGVFDSAGTAVLTIQPQTIKKVTSSQTTYIGLILTRGDGHQMRLHLNVEFSSSIGSYLWAEGSELDSSTSVPAVGRYTIILPMHDPDQPGTPQGDGYLAGQINANGQARFAGRTGTGQPFTVTGRLRSNNAISVGQTLGRGSSEFIGGELRFAPSEAGTVDGALVWRSYPSDAFLREVVPAGGRYTQPERNEAVLPHLPLADTSVFRLINNAGRLVATRNLSTLGRDNGAIGGDVSADRVKIQVNRATGTFSGIFSTAGSKALARFDGVLVQPLNRGTGQANFAGVYGSVELSAE